MLLQQRAWGLATSSQLPSRDHGSYDAMINNRGRRIILAATTHCTWSHARIGTQ